MYDLFFQSCFQGLVFLPLALGIFISFSLLKLADLSLEGSFVTGACVFARLVDQEFSLLVAFLGAIMAGFLVGLLVACIQKNKGLNPLIIGVLMLFILSSLNLIILGRPHISLLHKVTCLSVILNYVNLPESREFLFLFLFLCFLALLLLGGLFVLLQTKTGLLLRAFGDNPELLNSFGYNPEKIRKFGLAFSNSLAAFSGVLFVQIHAYAEVNMATGFSLIALATVLLGQQVLFFIKNKDDFKAQEQLLGILLGVLLYFLCINYFIRLRLDPLFLKLSIGVFLIFFLSLTHKKRGLNG